MSTTAVTQAERQKQIEAVEKLQQKYGLATLQAVNHLQRAVMLAEGIAKLREAVRPLLDIVIPLMNNSLGFDTDKKKTGELYPAETIIDCLVEAALRGLRWSGNEFNIIVGKCYTTKSGYERLVKELPGITDLDTSLSPPFQQGGHTCVKVRATWKLGGTAMCLKDANGQPFAIYAIRVNNNQGIDATLGKAARRMFKSIYELCTGTQFTEPNIDEETALLALGEEENKTQTQALADKAAVQAAALGITQDQIAKFDKLKPKLKTSDFAATLMRRGKNTVQSLTRAEADECLTELAQLADDGGEPPL